MELGFRDLTADDVECRVATVSAKGCSLLLYKNARCDMAILDETVGALGWQRSHSRDNANCTVSIWDDTKSQWISKEDTGTESYTEKEKGLASDSFKRACFNWGIGRELYTAPFIWVAAGKCEIKQNGSKYTTYDRFAVESMSVADHKITALKIKNEKTGCVVYSWSRAPQGKAQNIVQAAEAAGVPVQQEYICNVCGKPIHACKGKSKTTGEIVTYTSADIYNSTGGLCRECAAKRR